MAGKQKAKSDEPEILEGEVVDEVTDAPDDSASEPTGQPENRRGTKAPIGRRIPWLLVAFMAVFITGLFAAPWAEATLRAWLPDGWMPVEEPAAASVQIEEIDVLTGRLEALERRTSIGERGTADLSADIATAQSQAASRDAEVAALSERLAALSAQMDLASNGDSPTLDTSGLETRIAALEARPQESTGGVPGIDPDRLALLETEIAALKGERDALNAAVGALKDGLGQSDNSGALNVANLSLAVSTIAHPLYEGLPFSLELAAARLAADALEEPVGTQIHLSLNALDLDPRRVPPSRRDLLRNFDAVMESALGAEKAEADNAGWLERIWGGVTGIVKVRRVGDVEGDDTGAVLARAEFHVRAGELLAAAEELNDLTGPAAEEMNRWQANVMRRIDLDNTFNRLTGQLAALGSAQASGDSSP